MPPRTRRKAASKKSRKTASPSAKPGASPPIPASALDRKHLDGWIDAHRTEFERTLKTLVEIPSVSMDPARKADVQACAEAAADLLRAKGAEARVVATEGHPCVVGGFMTDPSLPTVTIYNHLDVQPADEPSWRQDPFRMSIEDGVYGGRGTTDDKGPALTALFGACYAVDQGLPLNVRFLWELEEEIGSPSFESFLAAEAPRVPTDSVVVSDTIWVSRGRPAVSVGLRGLLPVTLRLETGTKDVHSGLTGGLARNPIAELCDLIDGCVDARTGRVLIKGFMDEVERPKPSEIASFVASGFSLARFREAHGLKGLRTKDVATAVASIWALPTFEVHGIAGGYQGPGIKTAVPAWAEAKVSMRLVPRQTPASALKRLKAHVKALNPDVVVQGHAGLAPYKGPSEGPLAEAASEAFRYAFGRRPAFVREGGSIGAVVTMQHLLEAPIMFLGLSLPEHGYHAPNERFDWEQAAGGMRAFARYFEILAGRGAG